MSTLETSSPAAPVGNSRFANARRLALIALAYAGMVKLALILPGGGATLAAIWPASGMALAALLLSPRRQWRGILAVIFVTGNVVSFLSGVLTLAAIGFMAVNVIEMWACVWLMTRWCGNRVMFTRVDEVVALAACAYAVNGVFALIGAAIASAVSDRTFKDFYLTWWIADGLGMLIATPVLVAYAEPWWRSVAWRWRRLTEAAALCLVFCACAWLGFRGSARGLPVIPRPYWICAPLVWAALRFGIKGTTMLLMTLAVIAIGMTTPGRSEFPLGGSDFSERVHMVQFFLSVIALTALVLAAVVGERQSAREASLKFELQFRSFMRQLPGLAFIKDADGRVVFANEGYAACLGFDAQSILGKKNSDLFPSEFAKKLTEDDRRVLGAGRDEEIEYSFAGRDWMARKFTITQQNAPPLLGGVVHDISARKAAEREAESKAMLAKEREVSEMKSRFIYMTSHEFRTPMSAAMGSAELLHNHLERLTADKREELFTRISTSFQHMTRMLDDILTLNRIDANHLDVRLGAVDLARFLRDALDEIQLADRDAHRFELHLKSDFPAFITDMNLLRHILSNLLTNATHYSLAGTLITVRAEADSTGMELSVEDQGIGISPSDLSRLFQPFERGSNVGAVRGTGLGLNIVKRMTELLGGAISVDSVEGAGSRFTLRHPRLNIPGS